MQAQNAITTHIHTHINPPTPPSTQSNDASVFVLLIEKKNGNKFIKPVN